MKPDFAAMSKAELKRYVLTHRNDNEAFYALADRISRQEGRKTYPLFRSLEDMENYPELLEKIRNDPGRVEPE
jgi:hypothetical protein